MKKILLLIAFLATSLTYSQKKDFTISGIIKSAEDKEMLESATVHVERLKDSSIVSYTITDAKGDFKIVRRNKNVPWELYNLKKNRTETNNIAEEMPERIKAMSSLWEKRYN